MSNLILKGLSRIQSLLTKGLGLGGTTGPTVIDISANLRGSGLVSKADMGGGVGSHGIPYEAYLELLKQRRPLEFYLEVIGKKGIVFSLKPLKVKGKKRTKISESYVTTGCKSFELDYQITGVGNKRFDLNESGMDLVGLKQFNLENNLELNGTKKMDINESIDIKGKRDLSNILCAIDLV